MNKKSGKRECGVALLLTAALISIKFWFMTDVALVSAFAPAYSGLMLALIPTGVAPFIVHHVAKKPGADT